LSESTLITGYAAITALGATAGETFDALCEGKSAIAPVTDFDASGFACSSAATIEGLDATGLGLAPRDARTMDFHSFGLMKTSRAAHAVARLDDPHIPREQVAFFAGMGMVDWRVDDILQATLRSLDADRSLDYNKFYDRGYQQIYPLWPLCTLNNMAQAQTAIDLDLRGDNGTFSPHGESGAQAVREAERAISEGASLAGLAAGVSEKVCPQSFARHQLLGYLSPSGKLQPFGVDRDGSVLGEAAAALVFEKAESARARDLSPLGIVAGQAMNYGRCDRLEALAKGITLAMRRAIELADLEPADMGVIYANGGGGSAQDAAEARAIADVFGDGTPVTATKGALGNTLAAAGLVDAVLALIGFERGIVPPCASGTPGDDLGIHLVTEPGLELRRKTALVNVQGLSGQCASLALKACKE